MKIDNRLTLREVVGEHLIVIQGKTDAELSKVVAFNSTSVMLWNHFFEKDFTVEDVQQRLLEEFDVTEEIALNDAQAWVDTLKQNNMVQ